ncbi:N-acetylmuramoyl-L-alanine amidase [Alkalicoccus chagannorensis]|uniref:N-acetylmuramoyl-L-alanine amidase n=1 Tax=Alkalicoccus chagannorensis TaxID=427072 RepID=UPI0004231DE6|nr:N-acetylmuramoyl-L-alanine amidase [Alkalicoccus chagannorensis]
MQWKSIMYLVLAVVMLMTTFATSAGASSPFTDTDSEEIKTLNSDGIVQGYEDNEFQPQREVSRAEAATMIGRSLNLPANSTDNIFPDVPSTHFASAYIQAASDASIVNGYEDGSFGPDEQLNRGEMAAIIARAYDLDGGEPADFSDVPSSHQFHGDIEALSASGITVGYDDGTFLPEQNISREEFSLMLARALYPEFRPSFEEEEENVEEPIENEPETEPVDSGDTIGTGVVVNNSTLNVRPDPSTDRSTVGQLVEGQQVAVHERVGNWVRVSTDDTTGYVSHSFLMVDYADHSSPLFGETIVVDPGHGGSDPGATANGVVEKEIVLDVSLRLEPMLQEAGANVIMTRRSDWFPSLSDRVQEANNAEADLFLSVHSNAAGSTAAHGTETFYDTSVWAGNSRTLADELQAELLQKLGTNDRGVKTSGFYVIRNTNMPSALVELGFKTNAQEAAYMQTDEFRRLSADALYEGVLGYYRNKQ